VAFITVDVIGTYTMDFLSNTKAPLYWQGEQRKAAGQIMKLAVIKVCKPPPPPFLTSVTVLTFLFLDYYAPAGKNLENMLIEVGWSTTHFSYEERANTLTGTATHAQHNYSLSNKLLDAVVRQC